MNVADETHQFITVTADNASNNGTLLKTLTALVEDGRKRPDRDLTGGSDDYDVDPQRSMVRCLAHVIHLAVMAMLIKLKAVKKPDPRKMGGGFDDLTEEEAENITLQMSEEDNEVTAEEPNATEKSDAATTEKYAMEDDVDLTSAIQKVSGIGRDFVTFA